MIFDEEIQDDEPCYVISVAARMVNLHPQTLRYYERVGLLEPSRSGGNMRLYSPRDIARLRRIARLTEELGVNLAGVDVIMRMSERMRELQHAMEQMEAEFEMEVNRLRSLIKQHQQHMEEDRGR